MVGRWRAEDLPASVVSSPDAARRIDTSSFPEEVPVSMFLAGRGSDEREEREYEGSDLLPMQRIFPDTGYGDSLSILATKESPPAHAIR